MQSAPIVARVPCPTDYHRIADNLTVVARDSNATPSLHSTYHLMRILLVEDSRLLAQHLIEQLTAIPSVEALGVVDTEQEAIASIADKKPDIVVLDLHLKQGTGFGVLSALSKLAKPPITIVLTNYALPQYRERANALGARYFLDKSNEFDRLPIIIRDLMEAQDALAPTQEA
jgi:DNA-binding NarL/FixJ family response regulator